MSSEQLVRQLGADEDSSGTFSIDELLPSGGRDESTLRLDDLDEDDWLEILEDIDRAGANL